MCILGANMYILGANVCILGAIMYILGANMCILALNAHISTEMHILAPKIFRC